MILAAKLKLVGETGHFAKSNPLIKNAQSLRVFSEELRKRFGRLDTGSNLIKFTQAMQKMVESIRSFLSIISNLSYRCFPSDEELCEKMFVSQALRGLNSNSMRFVMGFASTNFRDIWKAALREESCLEYDRHSVEVNIGATAPKLDKSELEEIKPLLQLSMMELHKKINELTAQVQSLSLLINNQTKNAEYRLRYNQKRQVTKKGRISKFRRVKQKKDDIKSDTKNLNH